MAEVHKLDLVVTRQADGTLVARSGKPAIFVAASSPHELLQQLGAVSESFERFVRSLGPDEADAYMRDAGLDVVAGSA